jgi:hypothetical protein
MIVIGDILIPYRVPWRGSRLKWREELSGNMPHIDTIIPHADTKPHTDVTTPHTDVAKVHTDTKTHSDVVKHHEDVSVGPPHIDSPGHADKTPP